MLATRELMEELRGLLNLEVPERKLLTFVFFGLPEIEQNLLLDPPLAQRVALRVRLGSFDKDATEAYVKHRLRLAGASRMLFSPDAIDALHNLSHGVPRVINTLADNALFEAFLGRHNDVDGALMNKVGINLSVTLQAESVAAATTEAIRTGVRPNEPKKRKLDLAAVDELLVGLEKG